MRNTIAIEPAKLNLVSEGLSYEQYAALDAINAHGLMDIIKSPAFYRHNLQASHEPTPSMKVGLHVDMALFEPDEFAKRVVPKGALKGDELQPHHEVVTTAHYEKVLLMKDAVFSNPMAKELLLSGGIPQPVVCWQDRFHRLHCKARLDFIARLGQRQVAVDLKTASDASPEKFGRAVAEYRYDLQAAHYLEGARATGKYDPELFLFIVVQNKPPYDCFVYRAGESVLSRGTTWRDHAMQIYAGCMQHDTWPAPPSYQTIEVPYWAKPPEEEQGSGIVSPEPPPDDELDA